MDGELSAFFWGGPLKASLCKRCFALFVSRVPLHVSIMRDDCRAHSDYIAVCCADVERDPALKQDCIACCQCIVMLFRAQLEALVKTKRLLGAPADSHAAGAIAFGHYMVSQFHAVSPADIIGILRPQPGLVDILDAK